MTIKDRAKDLVMQYIWNKSMDKQTAKIYALIGVKERIKDAKDFLHWMPCDSEACGCKEYWIKIKQEIEKL
jgi:hypothetical protein